MAWLARTHPADGIIVSTCHAVRVAFTRVERADESGGVRGLRA